ncbi:SEC-C motif-containing protein [Austwickia chelonae]|uniref:UPF0225 protein AUCHE_05_06340 n=1 Tax=Austwickia chelonae NBRC 105200 TaxID=1184607 RepID=K6VLV8_9MICO|nr:YchJ family metal-binding protein [Austwickia chelonae]GAB77719.1 hypothetical protein AUCHE_05_06340 [Austwickia chelonae NBRC 105200]SEW16486.1 SEC-C motif-containing protein [Austwickia chelonae]
MSGAFGAGVFGNIRPAEEERCPCGGTATDRTYEGCCAPLHSGKERAITAEQVMRSRYSAFALGDEAYLLRTWHPRTRPEALNLDPGHRWISLEILETRKGKADDDTGVVTYRARSRGREGREHAMTETSRFERRAGRWVYVDGEFLD